MKKPDISKQVMKRVVQFEKERTARFIAVFSITVLSGVALLGTAVWFFASDLMEREALAFLDLFFEDPEIIREYWQDTLVIFWEELPREFLAIIVVTVVALGFVWVYTKNKRRIVGKKLRQLEKYR